MTVSKPSSETLLAARAAIQRSPVLQQFFQRARKENWPNDYFASILANALDSAIEGSNQDLREAARYLADEYMQFGDGMRIVSRETGRLVYKVTEGMDAVIHMAAIRITACAADPRHRAAGMKKAGEGDLPGLPSFRHVST